jgi:hypothetical protein
VRIDGSSNPYIRNAPAQHPAVASQSVAQPAAAPATKATASLRDVLTSEERDYFAQLEQLGPLTYGRRANAPQPGLDSPRGQRIDVRA